MNFWGDYNEMNVIYIFFYFGLSYNDNDDKSKILLSIMDVCDVVPYNTCFIHEIPWNEQIII